MRRTLIIIIIFYLPFRLLQGIGDGPDSYADKVFDPRIKTVQLYKEGWNLSYPLLNLNSPEKLVLHFDLLDDQSETYYYTFIHCTREWEKSDIFVNDYLEGFPENVVEDYKPSFNTTVDYIHYRLSFPNDQIKITLSGNYILCVYPYGNPEKPVLTRRFIITENAAKISLSVHRPMMTAGNNTGQQVDFTINFAGLNLIDPNRNVYSFLLQNGRWNNAKKNLLPDFYSNNELKYSSLSEKNTFIAGNEFRYFDIKSIRYLSEFIEKIDFRPPNYHVLLKPSDNREFKPYFYTQDFNGRYYIAFQEGRDPDTDADYVYVYFTLPSKYALAGGKMYVSGGLADWSFNQNNLMDYNPELQQYECTMLLKQGWYNYEYVFLKDGDQEGVGSKFEGSHYETENDYLAIVYYRNPRDRYDRVIGTAITNTLNRLTY
jgi:Domain of unknown function (DUF5103)